MKKIINWPLFRYLLETIVLVEILSIWIYFYPNLESLIFAVVLLAFIVIAVYRPTWAIYGLLIELLIGSKGYLLSVMIGDFRLSLRIAIWLVIMIAWSLTWLYQWWSGQTKLSNWWSTLRQNRLLVLAGMVVWAVLVAGIRGVVKSNIFFDVNAWLFWLIVLPLLSVKQWSTTSLATVISAGLTWLVAKTSLLLYAFTHLGVVGQSMIYRWVTNTQIAEITRMSSSFFRIFIQSQLYLLIFVAVAAWWLARSIPCQQWWPWLIKPQTIAKLAIIGLALMPIIISFSRSFWFGLVVISLFLLVLVWRQQGWSIVWRWSLAMMMTVVFSVLFIVVIVNFPWPSPQLSFRAGDLLEERLGSLDSEAGASSRWALWPAMITAIKQAPWLGHGFGATITYQSFDPRVVEETAGGYYTTYAFEWGWLEIIFKFGLLWAVWYFYWLGCLGRQVWSRGWLGQVGAIGLVVILAVHFFSPYLNHPLGIIWLAGLVVWLTKQKDHVSLFTS